MKPSRNSTFTSIAPQAAALTSLQAELERGRGEYGLQRLDSVAQILDELLPMLRHCLQRGVLLDQAQYALLLGSAKCLQGRLLKRQARLKMATVAFTEAVDLFERHYDEIESQKANTRFYTDYAIALFHLGRLQQTVVIIKTALDVGAVPSEAFGYLGLAYRELGEFALAKESLLKGLQLAPGDPILLSVLAETLDRAGRKADAAIAYREAGLACVQTDNLSRARELLDRAVEIDPTDSETLTAAVFVMRSQDDDAGAMTLIDRVLTLEGGHPHALGFKALMLRDHGDVRGAIAAFRKIDVKSRDLIWIIVEYASTLHSLGPDHEAEALAVLERGEQLFPNDTRVLLEKGRILHASDPDRAAAVIKKAVEIDPQSADLLCELGEMLTDAGDMAGATEALDQALLIDRRLVRALVAKANLLRSANKLEEALHPLQLALHLRPGDATILGALVDSLMGLGRTDEALAEVESEIERDPKQSMPHWMKGRILLSQGRSADALLEFERAEAEKPNRADLQVDIGETLCRLDRYDLAATAFDRALTLDPQGTGALAAKAYYLCDIADFGGACALLERAVALAPKHAWYNSILGWAQQHLGEPAKAAAAFRRASDLDPDNPWHLKSLGNVLYDTGKHGEAEELFEQLVAKRARYLDNPAEPWLMAPLSWCYYRLKRYDEALRLMQSCMSIEMDDISLHFDLALVLLASGRSAGVSEYNRAIERTQKRHVLRQRGLFYVALYDLVTAVADRRVKDDEPILKLLRSHLTTSGVDLAKLVWMHGPFPAL